MGKHACGGRPSFLDAGGTAVSFGKAAVCLGTAVLVGAAFLLASCAGMKGVFGGRVEKPIVSLVSGTIERLSFDEAGLLFAVRVENPNRREVKFEGYDYALFIEGERFLEGSQSLSSSIEPKGGTKVQFPLTVRFAVLSKAFADPSDLENAKYRLELGFRFVLPSLGETFVPLSAEGELPVLRAPSLEIEAVGVSRLDFTEADLILSFAVHNPNRTALVLDRFDFRLEVGGQSWADGGTRGKTGVGAGGVTIVKVPLRVSTFFIGQSGYRQLLETRPLSYRVTGKAVFSAPSTPPGGIEMPFDASGVAEVTR
jgi:LEA14-like dessication related protein